MNINEGPGRWRGDQEALTKAPYSQWQGAGKALTEAGRALSEPTDEVLTPWLILLCRAPCLTCVPGRREVGAIHKL